MQRKFDTPLSSRVLPVMLSAAVAISSLLTVSAIAAPPAAKPAHVKKEAPKSTTPEKKDTGDKSKGETKADKEKEAKDKAALEKEIQASLASATLVDSLDLLKEPGKYLNKKITFTGTFSRFADTALDYKKAFRDSRDYVTFFILRPDVTDHTIPMAEMKLFFPRKKSSEAMDLEPGDKIQIIGSEFSTALDEPWIDVEHVKILQKTEKHERKHGPEF